MIAREFGAAATLLALVLVLFALARVFGGRAAGELSPRPTAAAPRSRCAISNGSTPGAGGGANMMITLGRGNLAQARWRWQVWRGAAFLAVLALVAGMRAIFAPSAGAAGYFPIGGSKQRAPTPCGGVVGFNAISWSPA
jgi:hypothetical protein